MDTSKYTIAIGKYSSDSKRRSKCRHRFVVICLLYAPLESWSPENQNLKSDWVLFGKTGKA